MVLFRKVWIKFYMIKKEKNHSFSLAHGQSFLHLISFFCISLNFEHISASQSQFAIIEELDVLLYLFYEARKVSNCFGNQHICFMFSMSVVSEHSVLFV